MEEHCGGNSLIRFTGKTFVITQMVVEVVEASFTTTSTHPLTLATCFYPCNTN